MKKLHYKDDITLVDTEMNAYGDNVITSYSDIKCLFRYGMSESHMDFADAVGTDAHSYLDPEDPYVSAHKSKLEGMYLVFNRYNSPEWYKIERLIVGRTMLTDNVDNNFHVFLSKCTSMGEIEPISS